MDSTNRLLLTVKSFAQLCRKAVVCCRLCFAPRGVLRLAVVGVFGVVLSAWCAEGFDIPQTWSRRIADEAFWTPNDMPEAFRVKAEAREDEAFLRSRDYIVRCTLPHTRAVSGETLLSINVECA